MGRFDLGDVESGLNVHKFGAFQSHCYRVDELLEGEQTGVWESFCWTLP